MDYAREEIATILMGQQKIELSCCIIVYMK